MRAQRAARATWPWRPQRLSTTVQRRWDRQEAQTDKCVAEVRVGSRTHDHAERQAKTATVGTSAATPTPAAAKSNRSYAIYHKRYTLQVRVAVGRTRTTAAGSRAGRRARSSVSLTHSLRRAPTLHVPRAKRLALQGRWTHKRG